MEKKELVERLVSIWKDGFSYGSEPRMDLKVDKYPLGSFKSGLNLEVTCQYGFVNINFAALKALSEIFGTEHIDIDNQATCNYGSRYTATFNIYEPAFTMEISQKEFSELSGGKLRTERW